MSSKRENSLRRIDLLMPSTSQYGVLHHFTQKLYEAFVRAGYTCRLLAKAEDQLEVPKRDPPDLSIGFNGAPRNKQGELFCDYLGVPHLACLVDPPYHFLYLFNSRNVIMACDDRIGCRLLQTLGFERHLFLPHAVEPELITEREEAQFDLVLLATFIDFEKRRKEWRMKYPSLVCQSLDYAIEMAFSDPQISFIEAFDTVKENIHRKGGSAIFANISLNKLLQDLEAYIKGRDRVELVKAVKDAPLHIFGNSADLKGWKEYLRQKNIHVHPSVSFQQALEIMKKSKILLNPSLKNREGAHERVFAGIAAGALVITSESLYLTERFKEGEELIYYRHPHLDTVNDAIEKYLADEPQRLSIVQKGRKKVMEGETWDQRVITLAKELPPLIQRIRERKT
jgi:spore maturation protein CgeB